MLRTLTKGWYLCCYKYWPTNLNVYPNIYSRERNFLFKGNSTIQFHHSKTNKQRQVFWGSCFYLKITLKIKNCSLSNQIGYCSNLLPIKNILLSKWWTTFIIPALKCHISALKLNTNEGMRALPVPKKDKQVKTIFLF